MSAILLVGLGNPGQKYANTRHNLGFMVLDSLAQKLDAQWNLDKKHNALVASLQRAQILSCFSQYHFLQSQKSSNVTQSTKSVQSVPMQSQLQKHPLQERIFLLKPQTFMNNSGISVASFCSFYKIPLQNIVVVHDELDIEAGAMRVKKGGSSGGHNGLKSLDSHLGSEYIRLRCGIGRPKNTEKVKEMSAHAENIIDYVLGDFRNDDIQKIKILTQRGVEALLFFIQTQDFTQLQNNFSKKACLALH